MNQPIAAADLVAPTLSLVERSALLTTVNAVNAGLGVATVSLTYDKQTKTKARVAGEDFVGMPGVMPTAQIGVLKVYRRVDNKVNRKAGVVGKVYLRVTSSTRADGVEPQGYTNIRPEGITAFAVIGFQPGAPQTTQKAGV